MRRTWVHAIVSVLLAGLGGAAAAEPFALVYLTEPDTSCDLSATPPSSYQSTPDGRPILPPTDIPVGSSLLKDLCFLVWPVEDSDSGEVPCSDGSGTESCAEQALLTSNAGIRIVFFNPEVVSGQEFPKYEATTTVSSLRLAGGDPIVGRQGSGLQGVRLGQVRLRGLAPGGIFELTSFGGYVDASMKRVPFPPTIVATTINNCGNGSVEPGDSEECDDGNLVDGDGCSRTCQDETNLDFTGSVGSGPGSVQLGIDGTLVTLDLAFLPGAPAAQVVNALVSNVEEAPTITATALQVDGRGSADPISGQRFVTDGAITSGPIVDAGGGDLAVAVPEPSLLLSLAAGGLLLGQLHRRRRR